MDSSKLIASCTAITISVISILWYYRKYRRAQPPKKWIPVGRVSELLIYPLKSGYRNSVREAECTEYGFKQVTDEAVYKLKDRFLVTYKEDDNEFRTGRTHQKLVNIKVENCSENSIALNAPGMDTLVVEIPNVDTSTEILKFRNEQISMVDCGDEASSWLSKYVLEQDSGLRLGFHDESLTQRTLNHQNYLFYPNLTSNDMGHFSDLTAFLLINKSSIQDLNTRLQTPATPYQFRPNIIIDNAVAYAEDTWKWLKIGNEAVFYNVKPCTRCIFTTVDAETGVRSEVREPLKTLEKYRQIPDEKEREAAKNTPILGINLGLRKAGIIKTGDLLYVGVQ